MVEDLEESLRAFLEKGKEWERKPTNIPGVFILKLPSYKGLSRRLSVEVNPVDASGNPTKRRGLVIRDVVELKELRRIISEEKLEKLMASIDRINPPPKGKPAAKKEADIIEV
ncbi:MAG TPA: hypothetical protein ENF64_03070 [Hadesarchaea archaeon]|nr:hypothetical protein [Hadesarchaea archaeon]